MRESEDEQKKKMRISEGEEYGRATIDANRAPLKRNNQLANEEADALEDASRNAHRHVDRASTIEPNQTQAGISSDSQYMNRSHNASFQH